MNNSRITVKFDAGVTKRAITKDATLDNVATLAQQVAAQLLGPRPPVDYTAEIDGSDVTASFVYVVRSTIYGRAALEKEAEAMLQGDL